MSFLRQPINFASRQFCEEISPIDFPNIQTSMAISSSYGKGLYLGKLTSVSPKSKLGDFMQYCFLFFIGKSYCTI
jgi:hypothetical protein